MKQNSFRLADIIFHDYPNTFFFLVTRSVQYEKSKNLDSENKILLNKEKLEILNNNILQFKQKEKEYDEIKCKNNTKIKDLNATVIELKNSLMLQHNKNKYEIELSLNKQQNLYNQSITIQDNKLKKQFAYQNMQLTHLSLEIEKERNEYETKISYLNVTVEKLNTEINNLLNDIRELKNDEEHSRIIPRNVLEACRTFHRRDPGEFEFHSRNSYIDQNSQWGKNDYERKYENNNSHELKIKEELNRGEKKNEKNEMKVGDKKIEIKVTKDNVNENENDSEEMKYKDEEIDKEIDASRNIDITDSRLKDF